MILNTKGIELTQNTYINKEGKFLLKIENFAEDGFTNTGDLRFKLTFKGVEVGTKEPVFSHSEQFSVGASSLWKIKQLEVAIKAPEIYDINDFIGRYVIANIKTETYTKKDGTSAVSYRAKAWEYSQFNDKLPPIPEAKEVENVSDGVCVDITDEESPF
jgi:hypothetical protein